MRLDFFLHFDTHNLIVFSESGWPKVRELLMELLRMPEAATEVSFFQVLPTCRLRPLQCTEKGGEGTAVPLPPLPTPSSPAAHRPQPHPREGKATPHLSSLESPPAWWEEKAQQGCLLCSCCSHRTGGSLSRLTLGLQLR